MNGHSSVLEHMSRVQWVLSVACTVLIVTFKMVFQNGVFSWSTATVLVGIVPFSLSLSLSLCLDQTKIFPLGN